MSTRRGLFRWCGALGVAVAFVLVSQGGYAMWAELSRKQLVEQSDIIATGRLVAAVPFTLAAENVSVTLGVIALETVLKGEPGTMAALLLVPTPRPGIHSSDEIAYRVGQEGLWFLRLRAIGDKGIYLADHPQRFVPSARAGPIVEALKRQLR